MKTGKMKNYFRISTLLILIISTAIIIPAHNIHIGLANIVVEENTVSGKIIFYKDDFLKSLKKLNNNSLMKLNADRYDELKHRHMQKFLKAVANNKEKLLLIPTGNGENETSVWLTFKCLAREKIDSLKITWTALFELFDDQMNILNIKTGNDEKSFILTEDDSKAEIQIL